MRRKQHDFEAQMKNSEQFLKKLTSIKKASKEIKEKSKFQFHRNIWVKECKYLMRLERDAGPELTESLITLDEKMQHLYAEKGVFSVEEALVLKPYNQMSGYTAMQKLVEQDCNQLQTDVFQQLRSLISLVNHKVRGREENDRQREEESQRQIERIRHLIEGTRELLEELRMEDTGTREHIIDGVRGFDLDQERVLQVEESESHLKDSLTLMENRLPSDEVLQVLAEYRKAHGLLMETAALEMEKLNLEYEEAVTWRQGTLNCLGNRRSESSCSAQLDSIPEEGCYGGNSQGLYQRLAHIHHVYKGRQVKEASQRLQMEAPNLKREQIDAVIKQVEASAFREVKSKALQRNLLRQRQELLSKVQKQIALRAEQRIQKQMKEAEALARKEEQCRLEVQLQSLRAQHQRRLKEKIDKEKQEEDQHIQEERKKALLREQYLSDLSKKAEEVHSIKELQHKKERQAQERMIQQQTEEKKQRLAQNKDRVAKIHEEDGRKQQQKLNEQKEKEREKQQREQKIKDSVEQYPDRPKVERDPQRVRAPTESLNKKLLKEMDLADKVDLNKNQGYSVQQLMKDMRYKLNAALQDAGLAQTPYARQVINAMSKRPNGV